MLFLQKRKNHRRFFIFDDFSLSYSVNVISSLRTSRFIGEGFCFAKKVYEIKITVFLFTVVDVVVFFFLSFSSHFIICALYIYFIIVEHFASVTEADCVTYRSILLCRRGILILLGVKMTGIYRQIEVDVLSLSNVENSPNIYRNA